MEISTSQMKQNRLAKLAKGVKAAALSIDNKFRETESPYRTAMITLTYRKDGQWEPDHISSLIQHYRMWFKTNGRGHAFHYVWVMELTEVGRPHYHVIVWLPQGVRPPLPDKQRWWPHGMTQAVYAKSPVGYITKYASKGETKSGQHLPKKARLWGYGGLKMIERGEVAFALAPRWLKGVIHHESAPKKRVIEVTEPGKYGTTRTTKCSAWVLTAGLAAGMAFFSPFDFDGFTGTGIALSHRGHIEMLTPEGDSFLIPHEAKR